VQVLHDPQQRRGGGQPLDQPQQQLEQPPLRGLAGDRGTAASGRLGTPGKVGQQAGQLVPGGPGDRCQLGRVQLAGQAPQRLDHRHERQAFLTQRHATTVQHPHALLVGGGGQLLNQLGLADPRLPTDHHHQRLAIDGTCEQLAQPRQLLGAADEMARRGLVRHGA
jgi:hypothetical protein